MKKDKDTVQITIRKRRPQEAHHGGAWKVAFADFMTAMFALFLVLWLVNQSTDIKSAIAGYFQDPLGRADEHGSSILPGDGAQSQTVRTSISESDVLELRRDRLQSVAKRLEKRFHEAPDLAQLEGQIEVTLTDEGLRIELLEGENGTFFEAGAAVPSPAGRHILSVLGTELGALTLPVRIEGHTDAHPYRLSKTYTNWELSADRANAARKIMTESGLSATQITQIRAMAERQPRVTGDPYSPKNRRVTILMLLEGETEGARGADSSGVAGTGQIGR